MCTSPHCRTVLTSTCARLSVRVRRVQGYREGVLQGIRGCVHVFTLFYSVLLCFCTVSLCFCTVSALFPHCFIFPACSHLFRVASFPRGIFSVRRYSCVRHYSSVRYYCSWLFLHAFTAVSAPLCHNGFGTRTVTPFYVSVLHRFYTFTPFFFISFIQKVIKRPLKHGQCSPDAEE